MQATTSPLEQPPSVEIILPDHSFGMHRPSPLFEPAVHDPYVPSFEGLEGRIGIFGGSFDPVQRAHVQLALAALHHGNLDCVVHIPAGQNPLKDREPGANGEQRMSMLRATLSRHAGLFACPLELGRDGPSYMVDTLNEIRSQVAEDAELFFVGGADILPDMHRWARVDELFETLDGIITVPRDGLYREDLDRLKETLSEAQVDMIKDGFVDFPARATSSTQVRRILKEGGDLTAMLDPKVEHYVRVHGLYEGIRQR